MPDIPELLRSRLEWPFPSADCHMGIPLSNGTLGALLWAVDGAIRITLNRADYWDHRGGLTFGPEATYANLRRWLEEGDEARLRAAFEGRSAETGDAPPQPTRLPMGRVDLHLPRGASITQGGLWMGEGRAGLEWPGGAVNSVIPWDRHVLALRIEGMPLQGLDLRPVPPDAPEVVERFRRYGMPEPEHWGDRTTGGWIQTCPGEPAMAVAWHARTAGDGVELFITSQFGPDSAAARAAAEAALRDAGGRGYEALAAATADAWRGYWSACPRLSLPDTTLELLYYLGMYKLRGIAAPDGSAATLQGPWVEEYRLPPWSSDYHFNINVQECYWPAYAGNQIVLLGPLFKMLKSWEPRLRAMAKQFVGTPGDRTENGLQMPHAVDDRGTGMTGFWTGAVDHGCTAWVAQLMWLRHRYAPDPEFLREMTFPWLKGALAVYERMLVPDGELLSLPVSVSPEYGGAAAHAWGRNASFQLAAIHFLLNALDEAARELGEAPDPRWEELRRRVPIAAIGEGPEILLWEGQPLAESHRHHSHLAGVYPFDTLRPDDRSHAALLRNSFRRWTRTGMAQWTGWCMPWAAILHARTGNGDMAALLLETFRRVFMRPGYASTHDAVFPGFTVMAGRPDIMQVEAACAAAAAVMELLVHTSSGITHVFPAVPSYWREASFEGIRVEGGFLISAALAEGRVTEVRILGDPGGELRMRNPFGGPARVGDGEAILEGDIFELRAGSGETLALTPCPGG